MNNLFTLYGYELKKLMQKKQLIFRQMHHNGKAFYPNTTTIKVLPTVIPRVGWVIPTRIIPAETIL